MIGSLIPNGAPRAQKKFSVLNFMSSGDKPKTVSATKVAYKHFKEFMKAPVEGVTIVQIDALLFHVAMRIQDGIYDGITVHWELKIPENYPFSPPFGRIVPGYLFNELYHHHVFESQGICADFLGNFSYMQLSAGAGTGWTSSCDFNGLMINMQAFFADPDGAHPSDKDLVRLFQMDAKFSCESCKEMAVDVPSERMQDLGIDDVIEQESPAVQRARRELFCSVTKINVIDDPNIFLGYPIMVHTDKFRRIHSELFPELVSYEAYMAEYQNVYSSGQQLRTSSGNFYTNWLPMFINENRFKNNFPIVQTTLSVIANGPYGKKENDFNPLNVLKVLPALMNQQVVALMNGSVHHSESVINAYVSLLRLFKRLLSLYPKLQQIIDKSASNFIEAQRYRNKNASGDIGEFLIKMSLVSPLSRKKLTYANAEMKAVFLEEYFARQVRWIKEKAPKTIRTLDLKQFPPESKHIELLRDCFAASETSNRLLVFNLEMARTFIVPQFNRVVDGNFGLAPENVIQNFQAKIKHIKTNIVNYSSMMQAIGYSDTIKNASEMIALLRRAIDASARSGYDKRK